jgi:hypothetical protein
MFFLGTCRPGGNRSSTQSVPNAFYFSSPVSRVPGSIRPSLADKDPTGRRLMEGIFGERERDSAEMNR